MGMFFLTDQTLASNSNTGGPYGSFPTQWTGTYSMASVIADNFADIYNKI